MFLNQLGAVDGKEWWISPSSNHPSRWKVLYSLLSLLLLGILPLRNYSNNHFIAIICVDFKSLWAHLHIWDDFLCTQIKPSFISEFHFISYHFMKLLGSFMISPLFMVILGIISHHSRLEERISSILMEPSIHGK